ncbi:hypothetical protein ABZ953_06960 [Streptomyces sp. NPDC046465]|uniref:hypothetical protein n=1 Tax=Streptomyces sp. NPDC046465 TaxID=3155810 RepID=UPI0033EA094C
MARIQILELPMVHVGDATETPFILVIDQASEDVASTLDGPDGEDVSYATAIKRLGSPSLAEQIGARAVLVFADTIDIPANDVPVGPDDAFKKDVQDWAAGTNKTLTRIVETLSHPRKRAPRSDTERSPEEY